jgi:hypothetical protein
VSIEFPFAKTTDLDRAFGGISNYEEVLAACPDDFYNNRNPYSVLARKWFHEGPLDPAKDLTGYDMRAKSLEDAIEQHKYIQAWLGSFKPKHEAKMAVSGWLLSLMLVPTDDSQ